MCGVTRKHVCYDVNMMEIISSKIGKHMIHPNIPLIVKLITDNIKSSHEKKMFWAKFKNEKNDELQALLGLPQNCPLKAGTLFDFDIDDNRGLILVNYSATAHNLLHNVNEGWSEQLRDMRGLVFSFGNEIKLVSRGFKKFFNQSELPEVSIDNLRKVAGDKFLRCTQKEDGHMIEYFIHSDQLCATTRGRLSTPSADVSLSLMTRKTFDKFKTYAKTLGFDLMTIVCELIHPETKVHVNYRGSKCLYYLTAFDKDGVEIDTSFMNDFAMSVDKKIKLPTMSYMTIDQIVAEISRRDVDNKEGWVAQIPNEIGFERVKFKYNNYIGLMVQSKLSYKYIMNCIVSNRLEKMLVTLPEEIRHTAYDMNDKVIQSFFEGQKSNEGYKTLYSLYKPSEGSIDNFRTICRTFWKFASGGEVHVH